MSVYVKIYLNKFAKEILDITISLDYLPINKLMIYTTVIYNQ